MDASNATMWVAIISGLGAIMVAALGFMGTRKGTLANAEKEFRNTVIQENQKLRDRVDELEDELLMSNRRLLKLEAMIMKAGLAVDNSDAEETT